MEDNLMNAKQIEVEALHLTLVERAALAQKLLLSLDSPTPDEVLGEWLVEARRRAQELDDGTVTAVPAEEVRRKARALLR
jgi:putative addiction module component (TIGR02574 family)